MQPGENRPGPQVCPLHLADESSAWLLLLRRAPSSWTDAHRRQGWADPPLTKAAAAAARQWSVSRPPCHRAAASSDLRRAREIARVIAEQAHWPDVAQYHAIGWDNRGACTPVVTHSEVMPVVERALGSDAATVPHLEGRWLRVDLRASAAGSIGALAAGGLAPGRLARNAETSWTVKAGEAR